MIIRLSFILILFTSVVTAQDTLKDTDSIYNLDKIIIRGDKLAPKHTNLATTNQFLTKEQLNTIQLEKIMDRLVYIPGVLNVTNALGGPSIVIRGQDQNRVNVFFNGIPIRSNTENNVPMDNFFFSNSDIFLEKGSSSLIYGANSGGSVIRFDNRLNFDDKIGINLNSFWGNNGKQCYNAKLTQNISNKLKYLVTGNYFKRNSFRLSDQFDTVSAQNDKNRNNSDQNNLELMGVATYNLNQNHIISLTGMYDNGNYGYPPSIIRPRFRRMTKFKNSIIGLSSVSNFKYDFKLESNLYYTSLNDTLAEFTDNTYTKQKKYSHWIDESYGGRLIASKTIDSLHVINLSFDMKQDIHYQDWYAIIATTKVNTLLTTLEYQANILKILYLNMGTSYNYVNPYYTSKGDLPKNNLSALNYQLSVAYVPYNYLYKIHLGYSRTTIFPRMRDFFGIDIIPGYVPNPKLKEEVNDNFDLGIVSSLIKNKLSGSFSLFYNPINNLIVDVRLTDTTTQAQNVNSANFYGSELMLKYSPSDKLFAILSYTYLKSQNQSDNRTSEYIAYRPEHFLKLFLSLTPIQYFGVNIAFTYVSKQYYDNLSSWASIPDYILFDIGLQSHPIKNAMLWFKVNNLFDTNYFSVFDQPQAGREYRFGLTIDIKLNYK